MTVTVPYENVIRRDNATVARLADALGLGLEGTGRDWSGDWQWKVDGGGVVYRSLDLWFRWEGRFTLANAQALTNATASALQLPTHVGLRGNVTWADQPGPASLTGNLRQTVLGTPSKTVMTLEATEGGLARVKIFGALDAAANPTFTAGGGLQERARACLGESAANATWFGPGEVPGLDGDRLIWRVSAAIASGTAPFYHDFSFDAQTLALLRTSSHHADGLGHGKTKLPPPS